MKVSIIATLMFISFSTSFSRDGILDESFTFNTTSLDGYPIQSFERIHYCSDNTILVSASVVKDSTKTFLYYLFKITPAGAVDHTFGIHSILTPFFRIGMEEKIIVTKKIDSTQYIVKLNKEGSYDWSFTKYNVNNYRIFEIQELADKTIVLGVEQLSSSNGKYSNILHIDNSGKLLHEFRINELTSGIVNFSIVPTDGKNFNVLATSLSLVHYYPDWNYRYVTHAVFLGIDSSFTIRFAKELPFSAYSKLIHYMQKNIFFGDLKEYVRVKNSIIDSVYGITCYDNALNLDTTFNRPRGTIRGFEPMNKHLTPKQAIISDDKIVIVGDFEWYNGVHVGGIVRIDTLGNIDRTFNYGNGAIGTIHSVSAGANNDLFIAGNFTSYNGVPRRFIAKLKGDKQKFQYEWYNNLTIKPNPSTDICTIDNIPIGYSVRIGDILGNTVTQFPAVAKTTVLTIDTGKMSSGIYFVYIQDTDGNVMSKILTVEH